jgi:hypothetical protein
MLASPPGNTLAQNIGESLGEGLAARGEAVNTEAATAAETHKTAREDALARSLIGYREAEGVRARRAPVGKGASAKGEFTQKDRTKEWLKFVKDSRAENPDLTIAELKASFDEAMAAASPDVPGAPAAATPTAGGVNASTINAMTLDQLTKLDVNSLDPATAKVALARYKALKAASQ